MPVATMDAFRDHGKLRNSIEEDVAGAQATSGAILRAPAFRSMPSPQTLVEDGVRLFADASDKLLAAVAKKRTEILKQQVDEQQLALGRPAQQKSERDRRRMARARQYPKTLAARQIAVDRIRTKTAGSAGWTASATRRWRPTSHSRERSSAMVSRMPCCSAWAARASAPKCWRRRSDNKNGWPRLHILNSTVPAQIEALEAELDLGKTLFIVSSKSGSTTEPNVLADYFFKRVADSAGADKAGTAFHRHHRSRIVARNSGRKSRSSGTYSMACRASAAAIRCCRRSGWCRPPLPASTLPARYVGAGDDAFLRAGRAAAGKSRCRARHRARRRGVARPRQGHDLCHRPALASFGAWAEQLFAESTGKHGKGLIPIDGEPIGRPEVYGDDRCFVDLALDGETDDAHEAKLKALEKAGHPVIRIVQNSLDHIGQEFFRFEIATAVAGAVIGINPFDQPDVEASKVKTRELTAAFEKIGALPHETPVCSNGSLALFTDASNAEALRKAGADGSVDSWLRAHFARIGTGDYVAILAYHRPRRSDTRRVCSRGGWRYATAAMSRPASNSDRAFCIRRGRPTKAAPTAAYFSKSPRTTRGIWPIPGHRASFGVIKTGAGARRFRRSARTRPARFARPSQRRSRIRPCRARQRPSQRALA